MSGRFQGQVVVVTGGGAGIGRTYAHRFAAVVVADKDPGAGKRVADELRAKGGACLVCEMDVTDGAAAESMAATAAAELGGIDVLVNNAGIHLDHAQLPFTLEAADDWRRVLDVNVVGALICAAACRPWMASRGGGAIVNMSSTAAYLAGGAYSVSKLALNALTVSLAGAFAADGIRVNGIAPGLVDSPAAVEWWSDPARAGGKDVDQLLIEAQMIKRQGRMGDLADVCLFLCSADASFVTAQTILVDGGFTKKPY
jgi:3-oxoacyl-[acyl-carrier protein] reductase